MLNETFLSLQLKGCDAQSIYDATHVFIEEKLGIDVSVKVAGLGSDGAAVMIGRNNGVAAKFRAQVSIILLSIKDNDRRVLNKA